MAQKASNRNSELSQRRGIELPPLVTTFPDEMPKQLVSRYEGGLYGTHRHRISHSPEASKWSNSSSTSSMDNNVSEGASNDKNVSGTSNANETTHSRDSNDPEPDFDFNETTEERLERWRQFYSERPLEWYFKKDDLDEFLDNMLFERLYSEVQYTVSEMGPSKYRGQEQIRSFWDDVRKQLRDKESPVLEWPPAQEQQHCTEKKMERHFGAKRQSRLELPRSAAKNRTANGKSPELLKRRESLMEKAQQRQQRPGWGK
jgi:hypothetical protein